MSPLNFLFGNRKPVGNGAKNSHQMGLRRLRQPAIRPVVKRKEIPVTEQGWSNRAAKLQSHEVSELAESLKKEVRRDS